MAHKESGIDSRVDNESFLNKAGFSVWRGEDKASPKKAGFSFWRGKDEAAQKGRPDFSSARARTMWSQGAQGRAKERPGADKNGLSNELYLRLSPEPSAAGLHSKGR